MKKISILGSTGSIGTQTLDIIRRQDEKPKIVGLVCGQNIDVFAGQITEFSPDYAAVSDEKLLPVLKERLGSDCKTRLLAGQDGILQIASENVDWCMSAITGTDGILPTVTAVKHAKTVALANKEALVVAGEYLNNAIQETGCTLLPVDSEHSAIFQVLDQKRLYNVSRIILTASGGPFLNTPLESFKTLSPKQAVSHPNWSMGQKVSVDSACLINKLLELIEAYYLFGLTPDHYDVWIHPQSIVHSFVEYQDGSLLAQMGIPSMLTPIAYSYTYPDRMNLPDLRCNLPRLSDLSFLEPDINRFPIFKHKQAILQGGASSQIAFAVGAENIVYAFLAGKIAFTDIPVLIEQILDCSSAKKDFNLSLNLEDIMAYVHEIHLTSEKILAKCAA